MCLLLNSRAFNIYSSWLLKRPLLSRCSTVLFCMSSGDLLAQMIENKGFKNFDMSRTAKKAVFGFALGAPLSYAWFSLLGRRFGSCTKASTVLKKVTVDACVYSPVAISWFLFCMGMLDGLSFSQVRRKISTGFSSALASSWVYWPTVNLFLFKFVPQMYLMPLGTIFSFCFMIVLSLCNSGFLSLDRIQTCTFLPEKQKMVSYLREPKALGEYLSIFGMFT